MNSTPVGIIGTLLAALGATKVSLDLAAWVAVIGALGTGAYNFWKVRQNRPLVGSEIEDRAVKRMREAMDAYAEDNKRLRAEVERLEQTEREFRLEIRVCRNRIDQLASVLQRHGINLE